MTIHRVKCIINTNTSHIHIVSISSLLSPGHFAEPFTYINWYYYLVWFITCILEIWIIGFKRFPIDHYQKTHAITGLKFCQKTRMWVRFPVVALVSLSKTLNHNCFVLRMGRKAVGPMYYVMHVKEPSALIVKKRGFPRCVWLGWLQIAPLYKVLSYKWVS